MTYYTVCPDCGYKLFKLGDGSNIDIYCPKCKAKLLRQKWQYAGGDSRPQWQ